MSEELKYKLFKPTDCISKQKMFDYIDNKLSAKEQHLVEKHLLDCELCSDALEGLQMLKDRKRIQTIDLIIKNRMAVLPEKKIISINLKLVTSIAAGILLLVGGIFFFKNFNSSKMMGSSVAEIKETTSKDFELEEAANKDSATQTFETVTKLGNKIASGKGIDKKGKKEELFKEVEQKFAQNISRSESQAPSKLADREIVADELKSESIPKTSVNEDFRSTITTENTTLPVQLSSNNNLEKSKEKNLDNSKSLATGAASTQPDNSGYYAKQEAITKTSENNRFKTDNKKRAGKQEEAKKPALESTVTYSPPSLIQNSLNGIIAGESDDTEKSNVEKADKFSYLDSTQVDLPSYENGDFAVADEMPLFPGGDKEMMKFIVTNFKYPLADSKKGDEDIKTTKILVQFIVGKTGEIKNAKIIKGISQELDKEALRVVNSMPKWKSGKLKGENVDIKYTLPIQLYVK